MYYEGQYERNTTHNDEQNPKDNFSRREDVSSDEFHAKALVWLQAIGAKLVGKKVQF